MSKLTVTLISFLLCVASFGSVYAISEEEYTQIQTFIEQENIRAAHEQLKAVRSSESKTSALTQILIGKMYLSLGKPAKAYEHFERATFTSVKADALAYSGLAQASLALGNLPEAKEYSDRSLKEDPDLVEAKMIKAQILSDLGKNREAEIVFQGAIAASGQSLWATRTYAQSLMRMGQNTKAKELLQNALVEKKADAPTLDLLGKLFWTEGNVEEAVRLRSKAADQFILAGNQERADQIRNWLEITGVSTIEKFESGKPSPKKATENEIKREKAREGKQVQTEEARTNQDPDNESEKDGSTAPPEVKRPVFRARAKPESMPVDHKKSVISGSGVIMHAGRWVLTNRHVVEAVNTIVVRNGLGEVRLVEKVILSEKADLAILVLNEPYPAAYSLSDESLIEPKAGEEIYVIGYPLSSILGRYNPSITEGIVSKATGFGEKKGGFQLTAKVNPGNSGGPIVNSQGQLVGVTVGRLDKQQVMEEEGFIPSDVNLGIPASTIRDFLEMPEEETIKTAAEYDATEIYEYMRAAVVLVVGQK